MRLASSVLILLVLLSIQDSATAQGRKRVIIDISVTDQIVAERLKKLSAAERESEQAVAAVADVLTGTAVVKPAMIVPEVNNLAVAAPPLFAERVLQWQVALGKGSLPPADAVAKSLAREREAKRLNRLYEALFLARLAVINLQAAQTSLAWVTDSVNLARQINPNENPEVLVSTTQQVYLERRNQLLAVLEFENLTTAAFDYFNCDNQVGVSVGVLERPESSQRALIDEPIWRELLALTSPALSSKASPKANPKANPTRLPNREAVSKWVALQAQKVAEFEQQDAKERANFTQALTDCRTQKARASQLKSQPLSATDSPAEAQQKRLALIMAEADLNSANAAVARHYALLCKRRELAEQQCLFRGGL